MKKRIVYVTATIMCLILLTAIPAFSQGNVEVGKTIVTNTTGKDVEYVEKISNDAVLYPGTYRYTDGDYDYYVDMDKQILSVIAPLPKSRPEPATTINEEMAQSKAWDYFQSCMDGKLADGGNFTYEVYLLEGAGYKVRIYENIDGIQTGTSGSIVLSLSGEIRGASFHEGNAEYIRNLDRSLLMSEDDAIALARSTASSEGFGVNATVTTALKTIDGKIYWYINVKEGANEIQVQINALTNTVSNIMRYF